MLCVPGRNCSVGEELFMISHWFVTSDSNSSHTLTLSRFKFTQCKHIVVTTICSCDVIHQLPIGYLSSALGRAFKLVVHTSGTLKKCPIAASFAKLIMFQAKATETQHVPQQVWSIVEPQNGRCQSSIYYQQQDLLGQTLPVCPTYHSCFGN